MKKQLLSLAFILCLSQGIPAIVSATNTAATSETYSTSSNKVEIYKKFRNGGGIKTTVEYKIEDDTVYIYYKNNWYRATYSDRREYTYMVDFGGRNDVWYFNL